VRKTLLTIIACGLIAAAPAQDLSGRFHYRLIHVATGAGRLIDDARVAAGELDFQDGGALSIDGVDAAVLDAGGGALRLTIPVSDDPPLNARIGADSQVLLAASTTATGRFTLLAAVPRSTTKPPVSGAYRAARLDLIPALVPEARTTFGTLESAAAIAIDDSGQGTLSDGRFGQLNIAVSPDGNYIIGITQSGNGIFFATRAAGAPGNGLYWLAEFSINRAAITTSIGSLRPGVPGRARLSQQFATVSGPRDYRGASLFTTTTSGFGALATTPVGFGVSGSLVGASAAGILFAVPAPSFSGPGPFLHPHGIVNAASLAPFSDPVAPDSLVSLYGNGFLSDDPAATAVTINGQAAPIIFLSDTQINIHAPDTVTGATARFAVNVAGTASNAVVMELADSSPAIFSEDFSGVGNGLLTHADFSLITPASPARRGDTVIMWATGLGVDQTAPRILISGAAAEVLFAGRHPDFLGLFQINLRIPFTAPTGPAIPITLLNPEGESDTVTTAISP